MIGRRDVRLCHDPNKPRKAVRTPQYPGKRPHRFAVFFVSVAQVLASEAERFLDLKVGAGAGGGGGLS